MTHHGKGRLNGDTRQSAPRTSIQTLLFWQETAEEEMNVCAQTTFVHVCNAVIQKRQNEKEGRSNAQKIDCNC